MQEGGRLKAAFLLAAGVLCTLLLTLVSGSPVAADGSTAIGIDMQPGDAPASSASDSQSCVSVSAGDTFNADVFVTNVDSLTEWELRIDYDPSIVSLESADYNYLLVQSGGQIFPAVFEQEKPGRMFLAAAETHSPDSGSGVLGRLHLKALLNGTSSLQITTNPGYYGPRLIGARGAVIGDVNGDGIFDGTVTGGSVAVGRSCGPSTPPATPGPGPASPTPGPGSATPPAGSGGSNSGGGTATPGSGVRSGGDAVTPEGGNGQATEPPGSPIVANIGANSGPASTAGAQAGDSNSQPNNGDKTGQNATGNGGGSSSTLVIAAAVLSALAILVGAGLILARRRWTR